MATTTTKKPKAPIQSPTAAEPATAELAEPLFACNHALIVGELVTEPELRTLTGGTKMLSFSLTVRRPGERTTSVPLTWFDPPKRTESWKLGMRLVASGPVVRRFYRAGGGTGARTEVQVEHAQIATRRASAKKIIDDVGGKVADALEAVTG